MIFMIERHDVSWCEVEAESAEEALEIANNNPDMWEFDVGTPEAVVES